MFSGTGNARNVAHWIAAAWRNRDRAAEVVDVAQIEPRAIVLNPDDEVGIASPTHGFNFPPITLAFLFAFPRAPNRNRAFVVRAQVAVAVEQPLGETGANRHALVTLGWLMKKATGVVSKTGAEPADR